MKNQECKVRPEIVNINSNDPIFYPFSIKVNKCNGNCNNINDRYTRICVPDVVKNLNVKVLNLMSRNNETRHIEWHETCKCICRLDGIICYSKQRWNEDKCRCECKELKKKKKCCLSLHYNEVNSYLLSTIPRLLNFKAKDSEILAYSLCLRNISKDWSQDNTKKTGFNGCIYDFSADYNVIAVSDISDIHKYLMKKNKIV